MDEDRSVLAVDRGGVAVPDSKAVAGDHLLRAELVAVLSNGCGGCRVLLRAGRLVAASRERGGGDKGQFGAGR